MALLRRILYPDSSYPGAGCSENCLGVPACDSCIPPIPSVPEVVPKPFFFPPPPPASPRIDVNVTTQVVVSHKTHKNLTLVALVVSSILAALFLLVTYYVLFLRLRAHIRRRRAAAAATVVTTRGGPDPSPDEGEDAAFFNQDNVGGGVVHHVWFIRTVGLEQPMIDSITAFPYKRGDGLIESTDCSVCLSEFQDGELVRLLPKCCHAFHLPCIDTWLRSHLNCPLCRAPIVAPAIPAGSATAAASSSAAATAAAATSPLGGPDPAVVPAATVVGSERTDADSGSDDSSEGDEQQRTPSLRIIFPVPEDREETGSLDDSSSGTRNNPPAPPPHVASLSMTDLGFRVQSDLGASGLLQHLGNDDEWVTVDLGPDRGSQPPRRSVSMDLSAMGALFRRGEEEEVEESEGNSQGAVSSRKTGLPPCLRRPLPPGMWMMKHARDLKGGNNSNIQKQALGVERCSSTNSGGYIFSRLGRGRTPSHASILPL